jgi:subfamily B ATP-binding cassette protein MsbA
LSNKRKRPFDKKYESGVYLLSRLLSEHVLQQKAHIFFIMFCMLLISITTAINAWLMKPVLDEIFLQHNKEMLIIIPIAVLVNSLVKGIAEFLQSSGMKVVGQSIITDIQIKLYTHLIHADMRFLTEYPSGNLISRFTNDINAMRKIVSDSITTSIKDFFTFVGLVFVMFYQNTLLAAIAIFVVPLAVFPIVRLSKRMRKIAKGMQKELGGFTTRLDETFKNMRIIKSYCREEFEIARAFDIIDRVRMLYRKAAYVESASSPIMETLGGVIIALIIFYGGMQVMDGSTTPGSFFSFITALLMAYRPLKSISRIPTSIQEGLAACRRLFLMMDEKAEIKDDPKQAETEFSTYNIEFKNVYFAYDSGSKILDGLNMSIPQGKTVAMVGSSGSGKTTILNLIQRLYDANFGSVMLDGKDVTDVRLKSLRNCMALVSQDIALFDETVKENIRYGNLNATDEEIVDAAMTAAAHEFITSLPEGYDTKIGQHGVKLSGGQRQRLAIARAILKDAPILLLDEATSALDTISEKQVQMALEYLKKGRTTIIIAHRLSTIESSDIIYVIDDGKVVESGSHKQLLGKKGAYSKLYEQYKKHANVE